MEGWISEAWLLSKMKPMMKRKGELHGTGHIKFPCFGLIKSKFRCTDISSLDDLARVVNESAACNLCQLVSTQGVLPSCLPEIGPGFSPPILLPGWYQEVPSLLL